MTTRPTILGFLDANQYVPDDAPLHPSVTIGHVRELWRALDAMEHERDEAVADVERLRAADTWARSLDCRLRNARTLASALLESATAWASRDVSVAGHVVAGKARLIISAMEPDAPPTPEQAAPVEPERPGEGGGEAEDDGAPVYTHRSFIDRMRDVETGRLYRVALPDGGVEVLRAVEPNLAVCCWRFEGRAALVPIEAVRVPAVAEGAAPRGTGGR